MPHVFRVFRNGRVEEYNNYDSIPGDFEHVIAFIPEIPPGPHTHEQHVEIDSWNDKLQKLMEIERARSN
jgi:hypothetical protein